MRVVWTLLLLLVIVGSATLWNRIAGPRDPDAALRDDARIDEVVRATRSAAEPAVLAAPSDAAPGSGADPRSPQASANAQADPAAALAAELYEGARARGDAPHPLVEPPADALPMQGEPVTDGLDLSIAGGSVGAGEIVRTKDGAIHADGRFVLRGQGTREDPYRITWDLLVSAGETFQPRLGEAKLPQRVAMLHGAFVRIEGWATFPIFSFDPTEMLVMLNQWDGCCIGVPPTPFDAIEVKLAEAPAQRRRQTAWFGSVEGRLSVEPYLVENWLVGLYVLDEGRFTMDL